MQIENVIRVLITGSNSFLGENVKKYLEYNGKYQVDVLDMLDKNWRNADFSNYDVVFNVCAIVHRFDHPDESIYYTVNRDLAFEIATKAKQSGVKQFIQTSTVGVFGIELGAMNSAYGFNPRSPYEKSKYQADILIENLRDSSFHVCIIRPPMIYGNGCKGNFPKLVNFALKSPIFPSRNNQRDMIFIDNLCDFILYAMENELSEICYPRDRDRVSIAKIIKEIARLNNKKIYLCPIINPMIAISYRLFRSTRSVFGDNYCTDEICQNCNWRAPYSTTAALQKMFLR